MKDIANSESMLRNKLGQMTIAVRIALLAWLVALATLTIFVLVTVPQQKRIFLKNLESKANGLAVSLHDVAAGAAINEDYASVVSAAQTLLAGDPDLDFLIVMKNDGFSLVIEQDNWRVEDAIGTHFHPVERLSVGRIETVPMFERRVYHFAQPFDYSGIQWGWIHVGLSLQGYDTSVRALYRNTVILALCCIFFSLFVSALYARQMVRPIVRLRQLVGQIAAGDLGVRADMSRRDELGSLAESVNTMAEALLRRDHILESVRYAAQEFLRNPQWELAINDVLRQLGEAAQASRSSIYRCWKDENRHTIVSKLHEWTSTDTAPKIEEMQNVLLSDHGMQDWSDLLENNETVRMLTSKVNPEAGAMLERMGVQSLILIPIFVEETWWGALCLVECDAERVWTDAEEDSLRTCADMLGTTITRQHFQQAVLEAKATLEQRVDERTKELQNQVEAKEKALADLASAQSSLVEMSRAAGMAEVATGVLHNVGNVLNSVNVSCAVLIGQLRDSRVNNVNKIAEMLNDPEIDLAQFLKNDERGRHIPGYLSSLATALAQEHKIIFDEAESLNERIEHIKEIVSMQQSYGRVMGVNETITPEQLMEDAVKLNAGALARHNVMIRREYRRVEPLTVDKHKVLQILLNLINNAKYACSDSDADPKIITLRIYSPNRDKVCFEVADNGMGIREENITRIFQHGFTTRRSGHGFGLHSGALAARELGGKLLAHSDGPGAGATFTLELPCRNGVD